jgi:hypothetical protein
MDLTGKSLVVWLSPEAIETFLGVLEPGDERAMTSWVVAGQVVGEAGPGLWLRVKRVLMPDGAEMPLREEPVYFLRLGVGHDGAAARRAAAGPPRVTGASCPAPAACRATERGAGPPAGSIPSMGTEHVPRCRCWRPRRGAPDRQPPAVPP